MAKEKIYNIFGDNRSPILIANFKDGYSSDFHFVLPETFRNALDIKWTQRKNEGRVLYEYTQGRNFDFKAGDVIYDSKVAYEATWLEAVKHVNRFIQILKATPATDDLSESIMITDPQMFIEDGESIQPIKNPPSKVIIRKYAYKPGQVEFKLYNREADSVKFILSEIKSLNQEDFVKFLQSGK